MQVSVSVEHQGSGKMWLTAFTDAIADMLAHAENVSLASDSESIEDAVLDLQNIRFLYNINKKTITQILDISPAPPAEDFHTMEVKPQDTVV